jgi:hypothetical protein
MNRELARAREPRFMTVVCHKAFKMHRGVLTTYLMAVTLAGPWACCCATLPLGDLFTQLAECRDGGHRHNCCAHHVGGEGHRPVRHDGQVPRPTDGPQCPCPHNQSADVVPTSVASESGWGVRLRHLSDELPDLLTALPPAVHLPAGDGPLGCDEHSHFPFSTGVGILRALHILRC